MELDAVLCLAKLFLDLVLLVVMDVRHVREMWKMVVMLLIRFVAPGWGAMVGHGGVCYRCRCTETMSWILPGRLSVGDQY